MGRIPSTTDPVRQLIDEHEILIDALDTLTVVFSSVSDGAHSMSAESLAVVESVWHEVNDHLNVHFVKEEDVFFPWIERLIPGSRVKFQFLHVDHERLRECFERFTTALQDYRARGGSVDRVVRLRHNASDMIRWLQSHIIAEDAVYFEIAVAGMTLAEHDQVLARMRDVEDRLRERDSRR